MKIIEPSFKLSTPFSSELTREDGVKMLRFIEHQARISHRSEERQNLDSWEKFITAVVIQHGDWSVVEHASVTAEIRTDRGITHELVRHRLFSFTQESTRFVRYKDELELIMPTSLPDSCKSNWRTAAAASEQEYRWMLAGGARPQEARSILPNALAATISVTGNLRNWRHFLLMRTTKESHPDMKRITVPMLEAFKQAIPILFDDIEPDQRQVDNLRKAR